MEGKEEMEERIPSVKIKTWTTDNSGLPYGIKCQEAMDHSSYADNYSNASDDVIDNSSVKNLTENKQFKNSRCRTVLLGTCITALVLIICAAVVIGIWRGVENSINNAETKEGPTISASDCSGFLCDSGSCIRTTWLCDGIIDCAGAQDELVSRCGGCQGNLFSCHNQTCIDSYKKCNGIWDCSNGEDEQPSLCNRDLNMATNETNVTNNGSVLTASSATKTTTTTTTAATATAATTIVTNSAATTIKVTSTTSITSVSTVSPTTKTTTPACSTNYFRCNNRSCISSFYVCDGYRDCPGGEDESYLLCGFIQGKCSTRMFLCGDGRCISFNLFCDGFRNCKKGEDESSRYCKGCSGFRCSSGTCIPSMLTCDGNRDCTWGDDEQISVCGYCHGSLFSCYNGSCISRYKRCNGISDCSYAEDETGCTSSTTSTTTTAACSGFRCYSGMCISLSWICDGMNDCTYGEDELSSNCRSTSTPTPSTTFSCSTNYFRCNTRYCVFSFYVCDGYRDCPGGEDESPLFCGFIQGKCSTRMFLCGDGRCISSNLVCDGFPDCSKGEDESSRYCNAPMLTTGAVTVPSIKGCGVAQFPCRSGNCISNTWVCDGTPDCSLGEDESFVLCGYCGGSQFQCKSGECITNAWICDIFPDCSNAQDESYRFCGNYTAITTATPTTTTRTTTKTTTKTTTTAFLGCRPGYYRCASSSGYCISNSNLCDGYQDCSYGDDEHPIHCNGTCRSWLKMCTEDGSCISSYRFCDGSLDCPAGSDENNCSRITTTPPILTCSSSYFRCSNGNCIPRSYLCDGYRDCSTGEDENAIYCANGKCNSYLTLCPENGSCIYNYKVCDSIKDCPNGSDEMNCTYTTRSTSPPRLCYSTEFRCNNGKCIPITWLCDAVNDCGQGEDEIVSTCNNYKTSTPSSGTTTAPSTACYGSSLYYRCTNGDCIYRTSLCNGFPNCQGGEDENPVYCNGTCPNGLIKCSEDSSCIYPSRICDGTNDCPSASDEANCSICIRGRFRCGDGKCISETWLCDGVRDCNQGEDELVSGCNVCNSSQFQCSYNRTMCVANTTRCDGTKDCLDGSDEAKCYNIGAESPGSPGNSSVPVQIIFRGQSNYSICSDNWESDWFNITCKEIGYSGVSTWSYNLTMPVNGQYLVTGNNISGNIFSSLQITSNCSTGMVIGFSCKPLDCDRRYVPANSTAPYVINGENAARGAWPWQISMRTMNSYGYSIVCGGALLNDRWILTAGHCVRLYSTSDLGSIAVQAGSLRLDGRQDPDTQLIYVNRFIQHPQYYYDASRGVLVYDVALLRLASPVTFTDTVRPICLPTSDVDLKQFKTCIVTGWGQTRDAFSAQSPMLKQGKVKIQSDAECMRLYNGVYYSNAIASDFNHTFCAGDLSSRGVETCYGDSGGPVACQDQQGIWYNVGVTSFGDTGCKLSFYSRVSQYVDWINDQMRLYG